MAKICMIQREVKRAKMVNKYARKRAELKAIIADMKKSDEERYDWWGWPNLLPTCRWRSGSCRWS